MDRYSIMDFRPRNLLRYRYKGLGPEHGELERNHKTGKENVTPHCRIISIRCNRNTTLCMRTKASSIGLFPLFY